MCLHDTERINQHQQYQTPQQLTRNSSQTEDDASLVESEGFSEDQCAICLERFKSGEEVCYSQNEECTHTFHRPCITAWLLEHEECPCCRRSYLYMAISMQKQQEVEQQDTGDGVVALDITPPDSSNSIP